MSVVYLGLYFLAIEAQVAPDLDGFEEGLRIVSGQISEDLAAYIYRSV